MFKFIKCVEIIVTKNCLLKRSYIKNIIFKKYLKYLREKSKEAN